MRFVCLCWIGKMSEKVRATDAAKTGRSYPTRSESEEAVTPPPPAAVFRWGRVHTEREETGGNEGKATTPSRTRRERGGSETVTAKHLLSNRESLDAPSPPIVRFFFHENVFRSTHFQERWHGFLRLFNTEDIFLLICGGVKFQG